jgi:hypothetical protein
MSGGLEPRILEICNETGVVVRDKSNNGLLPVIPGDNLVAANHFRVASSPDDCNRYSNLADSLQRSAEMTENRSWNMLAGAAIYQCVYRVQYVPSKGRIRYGIAAGDQAAIYRPYASLLMNQLFLPQ